MATVTLTETHVNRPEASADSYTTKTTAETMNSSMISGEPMESSIARAIKGRKSMDEYIRPVLDLQSQCKQTSRLRDHKKLT